MEVANDVTDRNGMKHDDQGLFAGYSGSAHGSSGGHHTHHGEYHGHSHSHGFHQGGMFGGHQHSHTNSVFRIPNVKTQGPAKEAWRYVDSQGTSHPTRVDRITNKPISAAMDDAINRLFRGEEIPMEVLENLPEIKREAKLADAYCTLDTFMHPEDYENKEAKLNAIYRKFSDGTITPETNDTLKDGESYQVKQGKELWLVTGLPGSGKSTTFVGPISKANQARVVDSDAIKEHMPGFCKGLGAPNVHEQSKSINDRILAESLKRGDNIVYPVLGYNAQYVGDQIDSFRRKGYKVHLVLNELPFSQSLARCLERRLAKGRNIPLAMFKKVGDRPSEAYEILKHKVDTYEKHTGDGITRKKVENGENKNLPPPKREPIYSYHGMPLTGIQTYSHDPHGNIQFQQPQSNSHVEHFAKEFGVKPQKKPMYWHSSWLDSFKKKMHGGHDAMDAAEQDNNMTIDRFSNISFNNADRSVPNGSKNFTHIPIPDALDGEIDGSETAKDLARFHYIAYDCDYED